jgi:hypothetical protein
MMANRLSLQLLCLYTHSTFFKDAAIEEKVKALLKTGNINQSLVTTDIEKHERPIKLVMPIKKSF